MLRNRLYLGTSFVVLLSVSACDQNYAVNKNAPAPAGLSGTASEYSGKTGSFSINILGRDSSFQDSFRPHVLTGQESDSGHECRYFKVTNKGYSMLSVQLGTKPNALQRQFFNSINFYPPGLDTNFLRFSLSIPNYSPSKREYQITGSIGDVPTKGGVLSFVSSVYKGYTTALAPSDCDIRISNSGDKIAGQFSCVKIIEHNFSSHPGRSELLSESIELRGNFQCDLVTK